jgi:hypothetical protein
VDAGGRPDGAFGDLDIAEEAAAEAFAIETAYLIRRRGQLGGVAG